MSTTKPRQLPYTPEDEALDLGASEIACAVADAWAHAAQKRIADYTDGQRYAPGLVDALDRLEEITRTSAMRKVRP